MQIEAKNGQEVLNIWLRTICWWLKNGTIVVQKSQQNRYQTFHFQIANKMISDLFSDFFWASPIENYTNDVNPPYPDSKLCIPWELKTLYILKLEDYADSPNTPGPSIDMQLKPRWWLQNPHCIVHTN